MLVMADRSVQPFTKPVFIKTFWIDFKTQMAVDIIDKANNKEPHQVNAMNRDCEQENNKDH